MCYWLMHHILSLPLINVLYKESQRWCTVFTQISAAPKLSGLPTIVKTRGRKFRLFNAENTSAKSEAWKRMDCLQRLHSIPKWLALEVWGTICYPIFSSQQHVINTVLSSSPYAVSSSAFCKSSLVGTYIPTLFVPKRLFRIKIKLDNSWSPLRSVSLWGRGVVSSKA